MGLAGRGRDWRERDRAPGFARLIQETWKIFSKSQRFSIGISGLCKVTIAIENTCEN